MSHLQGVSADGIICVRRRLVEFLVFNSICQLKGVPSDGEKVVQPFLRQVEHFLTGESS